MKLADFFLSFFLFFFLVAWPSRELMGICTSKLQVEGSWWRAQIMTSKVFVTSINIVCYLGRIERDVENREDTKYCPGGW